jgi:hypothetical protein
VVFTVPHDISRPLMLTLKNSELSIKALLWMSPGPSYRHQQKVPGYVYERCHVARHRPSACGLYHTRHAALHSLEDVSPFIISPTRAA